MLNDDDDKNNNNNNNKCWLIMIIIIIIIINVMLEFIMAVTVKVTHVWDEMLSCLVDMFQTHLLPVPW